MPVSDTCSCPGGNCGLMLQRGEGGGASGAAGTQDGDEDHAARGHRHKGHACAGTGDQLVLGR